MFSDEHKKKGVTFPRGFKAAGVKAGIKKSGNLDLALIYTEKEAAVAGTFTKNRVAAAPVYVSKEVVKGGKAHAVCANAGCANACLVPQVLHQKGLERLAATLYDERLDVVGIERLQ
ncbi:MAG: bifunctional ornithine acetyltransferase/N-acetylglutamate synthase, partial [Schwartzia sp.]|nr:bifunctional ornithine acetyltransferase/N-acetylglutamate synthase [Schwartzia sp. (in: firmicutes)]